jgi:hypothetical protein
MHLFTVTENVVSGFRLRQGREVDPATNTTSGPVLAHISQPLYSAVIITLEYEMAVCLGAMGLWDNPEREPVLLTADVQFADARGLTSIDLGVTGESPYADEGCTEPRAEQALVRVQTAAGEGGRVAILPRPRTNYAEGDVNRKYEEFPPNGVQFLGSAEDAAAAHHGLHHEMDMLLLLDSGGQFYIERTGDLDGAPAVFVVTWVWRPKDKEGSLIMTPKRRQPRPETWGSVVEYTAKAEAQRAKAWRETAAAYS